MWKILTWIAAAVVAVSAYLAHTNGIELKAEKNLLEVAKNNEKAAAAHLASAKEALVKHNGMLTEAQAEQAKLEKNVADTKVKVKEKEDEITEKKAALQDVTTKLADMKKKLDDAGGIEKLQAEIASLKQQKATLEEQLTALKGQVAATVDKNNKLEAVITTMKEKESWQNAGVIPTAFRARVSSVDNAWGYAVISAGDNSEVVGGATLDVKRGNSVIGQLKVTNVEPSRAVADVIKGSVAQGDSIHPGDVVVVNSESSVDRWRAKQAAPAKPAGAAPVAPAPGALPDPAAAPADPFAAPAGAAPAAAPADPFAAPAGGAAPAAADAPPAEAPEMKK